jgi:signal transduction histidine kinase
MRNRLLLVMVAVVALVLAVHDVPLARHLERVERDRLVTKYERDAFILAGRSEEALEGGTAAQEPALRAIVARYASEEEVDVVVVDAEAIGVIGSEDGRVGENMSNRPEIVDALVLGAPQTGERFSTTLGEDLFFVAVPVLSGNERVGAVRISVPERVVAERVSDQIRGLLLVALLSLVMAMLVAWLFARSVTRPIRRLEATTDRLAAGDLAARADTDDGPGEVRALAGSFNSMAGRLGQLVDRQRAFAGTASHQLRTPLTALRLRLEQLSMEVEGQPQVEATVESALAETDRLHRMIEGLLALTRAEDAAAGTVDVDVAAIVRERADHWLPLADEQEVRLEVLASDPAVAEAVPGAVEQIVDNLVDNALEVSPAGSTLTLRVAAVGGVVELHVIDEGPGMSDDHRERAFERFWRAEGAPVGGSGLGLAIVEQLVAAGDGTVELSAAPAGGIDAFVRFRAAARPAGQSALMPSITADQRSASDS